MSKQTAKRCGHCGDMRFILIRSNGKMSCRVCVAEFLSQDAGCSVCRAKGNNRRWYKNRGSLCVNCLVAAMRIDEEAIEEKLNPKQKQPKDSKDQQSEDEGIYAIGSDAWIENNENYRRVLAAWTKEVGGKV
jgi:hypothetical protein